MFSWERLTTGLLDGIGLRSIKSKIIIFSLLAALIPSVVMGWLSYRNNRRSIEEKINQELSSLTEHASRELDLWLKERLYDIRVLSNSYEVSENLETIALPEQPERDRELARRRLGAYLESIGDRFTDYEEFIVVNPNGDVVASSSGASRVLQLEGDWLPRATDGETVVGDAYWDAAVQAGVMVIVEPILGPAGRFLGAMVAKIRFEQLDGILSAHTDDPSHEVYLLTRRGEVLISSRELESPFKSSSLEPATAARLFGRAMAPVSFQSFRGNSVLGTLRAVPGLEWGVVAEKDRTAAYAAIVGLRNATLTLIGVISLAILLSAYLLGLTIVSPLRRLTQGATTIAGGDLDVKLPIYGRSEVSYMTLVFNEMVARLRTLRDENTEINQALRDRNEELRALSVTDGLTGLHNRTYLPELLSKELARSRRHGHPFSILMVDIDHFKRFNDEHGHQAGDEALKQFAGILQASVRACDAAVRYGGEEFLVLLAETGKEGAVCFAEKLRSKVESMPSKAKRTISVSIGVASFPDHGEDVEGIIRQADKALYRCKRKGRNQVAVAAAGKRKAAARGR